jgi:uncharacterized membrane protein
MESWYNLLHKGDYMGLFNENSRERVSNKKLPRLRHEYTRAWAAVAISIPLTIISTVILTLILPDKISTLLTLMISWVSWSLAYGYLTFYVYAKTNVDELPSLVSTRGTRIWQRILAGGSDGPGFSVQLAALALVGAALLPRVNTLVQPSESAILIALVVTTIVTAWALVTLSYAVHYARCNITNGGGLDFPGGRKPGFPDYLYFSASVATTFGTTDVNVTSRTLRKVVAGHAILAFVFNTVILVSALSS